MPPRPQPRSCLTIGGAPLDPPAFPILDAAFRPFFLGASLFSVVTVLAWMAIYVFAFEPSMQGVSRTHWHAHEMLYGFTMAVVAGFLLTAIERWTGVDRLKGPALLGLFVCWLVPRVLLFFGTRFVMAAGALDVLFMVFLSASVARSIVLSRQWQHMGVLSKVLLAGAGQVCFYLGCLGVWDDGARVGVYVGLYLMLSLILEVGRRVVPVFIQMGLGLDAPLFNARGIDLSSLGLFLAFFTAEMFRLDPRIAGVFALALFVVHAIRLAGWYRRGIWGKPLLWSLFLGLVWVDVGFLLFALSGFGFVSRFLALHAFSYGGIGLVTLSMMSRIALGHTGRSIHHVPTVATAAMVCVAAGAVVRVFFLWAMPAQHMLWIAVSQGLWVAGFGLYLVAYGAILMTPDMTLKT